MSGGLHSATMSLHCGVRHHSIIDAPPMCSARCNCARTRSDLPRNAQPRLDPRRRTTATRSHARYTRSGSPAREAQPRLEPGRRTTATRSHARYTRSGSPAREARNRALDPRRRTTANADALPRQIHALGSAAKRNRALDPRRRTTATRSHARYTSCGISCGAKRATATRIHGAAPPRRAPTPDTRARDLLRAKRATATLLTAPHHRDALRTCPRARARYTRARVFPRAERATATRGGPGLGARRRESGRANPRCAAARTTHIAEHEGLGGDRGVPASSRPLVDRGDRGRPGCRRARVRGGNAKAIGPLVGYGHARRPRGARTAAR